MGAISVSARRMFGRSCGAGAVLAGALWCPQVAEAQLAETRLPELWVDSNGIVLTTGQIRIHLPLLSFGSGVGPEIVIDEEYPAEFSGFKRFIQNASDPFLRGSMEEGYEFRSIKTPSGVAVWDFFLPEYSTGTGYYYKRPAGGTFNVPYYDSPDADPEDQVGWVDASGNRLIYDPNSSPHFYYVKADGEEWRARAESSPFGSRIRSVSTNRGFFIQYEYEREVAPTDQSQMEAWTTITSISGASLAHVYCDISSTNVCQAAVNEGNSVTFDYSGGLTVTRGGAVTKYLLTYAPGAPLEITSPGTNTSTTVSEEVISCGSGGTITHIREVTSAGSTWTYDYWCLEGEQTNSWYLTRTNPAGGTLTASGDTRDSVPANYSDELQRPHGFAADRTVGYVRLMNPEGGGAYIERDARNNVVEGGQYAKDNVTKLVGYQASFPSTCSNFLSCNRPTWTKDGNGNQTDYTYDPQHGGVLTETGPADANGIRPQRRYEYTQKYAWLKNASSGYSQASTPIWVLTKEEHCLTTAAAGGNCTGGAADEVVTTYDYGPNSAPNNLLLRGVVVTADGQSLRTCFSYDRMGRKISETAPAANLSSCP